MNFSDNNNTASPDSAECDDSDPILEDDSVLIRAFTLPADAPSLLDSTLDNHAGNLCRLSLSDLSTVDPVNDIAQRFHATRCALEPATFPPILRCFNDAGDDIQCCGHGLLSAAFHLMQRDDVSNVELAMGKERIKATLEDGKVWLGFSKVSGEPFDAPWISDFLPEKLIHCVFATQAEDGYLIVQLGDGVSLGDIAVPDASIGKYTQRALIVTAAQPDDPMFDIQFRYFAPQYGVVEDQATGSAMRILAGFWQARFSEICALQASQTGGLLYGRSHSSTVEVGGYCAYQHP